MVTRAHSAQQISVESNAGATVNIIEPSGPGQPEETSSLYMCRVAWRWHTYEWPLRPYPQAVGGGNYTQYQT